MKRPIRARDVRWRVLPVSLPLAERLHRDALRTTLADSAAPLRARISAAFNLAWIERPRQEVDLACLRLGSARFVDMPGELFVEYQLAAAKMRPKDFVAMAAYGEHGPGYIGTRISYSQGGYEPTASRTAPEVEDALMSALARLLK